MFCSRCGKKVLEYMKYCPFCGTEVVIPGQDWDANLMPVQEDESPLTADSLSVDKAESQAEHEAPNLQKFERFSFDEVPQMQEPERPAQPERFAAAGPQRDRLDWSQEKKEKSADEDIDLFMDDEDDEEDTPRGSEHATHAVPTYRRSAVGEARTTHRKPARRSPNRDRSDHSEIPMSAARQSSERRVPERRRPSSDRDVIRDGQYRRTRTAKPVAKVAQVPDDMFMDGIDDASYDDYDAFDDRYEAARRADGRRKDKYADPDDDDAYMRDERDGTSFVMRHIRGIVGLILFLVLILLLVFYFLSDSGQRSLARINATLPLNAEIYANLGKESYDQGDFRQAGVYYERALARDSDSYAWASSAAMSYKEDGNIEKETEMLVRCIEIDPLKPEPYHYLLSLYPNALTRPEEISRLILQGYQMTGDERLNQRG